MTKSMGLILCGASLLAAVTTCTVQPEHHPIATADSSGVRVVTLNNNWRSGVRYLNVETTPVYSIGSADGDDAYLFTRLGGVVPLPSGVVVADRQSHEIRLYNRDGVWVRTLGRSGSGPGEFQSLQLVGAMAGDTLVAWDEEQRRLSYISPELDLTRTEQWEVKNFVMSVNGVFPNGALLKPAHPEGAVEVPIGRMYQPDMAFVVVHGSFVEEDTLAVVPGRPVFRASDGQPIVLPFVTFPGFVISGGGAWIGSGHSGKVFRIVPDSGRVAEVRWGDDQHPVQENEFEDYKREYLASTSAERVNEVRRRLDEMPMPARRPAFDTFRPGNGGEVWIRRYPLPTDAVAEWVAFSPEGIPTARMELPLNFALQAVYGDRVIGTIRSDLGVISLLEFRIVGEQEKTEAAESAS